MRQRPAFLASLRCIALWSLMPSYLACAAPSFPPTTTPNSSGNSTVEKPHSPTPAGQESQPQKPNPATTIVVEAGSESDGQDNRDLVSIARAAKRSRKESSPPSIVITNETLAKRHQPTSRTEARMKPIPVAPVPLAGDEAEMLAREAQADLWKSRATEIRTRLKAATEKRERLRRLTANMRERFYLSPPQLGRDDSLWQEWGRLQESLVESEKEAQSTRTELETFLEEGRIAGAEPGWLASGEELLQEVESKPTSPSVEAIEPPILPPPGAPR